jgi:hypothetical protein
MGDPFYWYFEHWDSSAWWSVAVDIVRSPYPSNACRHSLEIGEEA